MAIVYVLLYTLMTRMTLPSPGDKLESNPLNQGMSRHAMLEAMDRQW